MLKAVEATIDENGEIHLNEPVHLSHKCRAILTIVDEPEASETALLSEDALSRDWERSEEDEGWAHLQ